MTTPALARLRERFPSARITLLTHEKLADLWLHHPSLDGILTFAPGASPWSVARRLRREKFEVGLVLPNSPRSALEAWLAQIPQRIGYARPWRNWFLTQAVAPRPGHVAMRKRSAGEIKRLIQVSSASRVTNHAPAAPKPGEGSSRIAHSGVHQIHEYLHLTAALGANAEPVAPQIEIREEEVHGAENRWLAEARQHVSPTAGEKSPIWLGLNPSAAYGPAKRWPAVNFVAAVREVSRRIGNCVWLVFGSANDRPLVNEIAQWAGNEVINLAGKTTLRELMGLLKLCRVLLTNDSGPMHLAAALGTPVVVPFGSTAPELTGPGLPGAPRHYLLQSDAPCSPCFRRTCPIDLRCMTGISVEEVAAAVCQVVLGHCN